MQLRYWQKLVYHAGQVCVSVQRIFAHRSIARELAERIAALGSAMVIGDPTADTTDIGPLINSKEVDRIASWVDEAVNDGAELLCGGKRLANNCYEATVLLDPPSETTLSKRSIWACCFVYSYDDMDEALTHANALMFAFQAAVFSKDIDKALYAYNHLDAATVMINNHTAFHVDWMPFAGLKHSGHGVGSIPYTFEEMQVSKLAVIRSPSITIPDGIQDAEVGDKATKPHERG